MLTNQDDIMHLQRKYFALKAENVELQVHCISVYWFMNSYFIQHEMVKIKEEHEKEKAEMKKASDYEILKKNLELTVYNHMLVV
jgi:hypothetical protein